MMLVRRILGFLKVGASMANPKTLRRAALALGIAGVSALLAQVIAACGSTPQTNAPDTGAAVHIGVVIALSGDLKGTGVSLQNAALVAEQQINAYGGILGRPVSFDVKDDQTDQGTILQGVVNDLLGSKVSAMLGPIGSTQVDVAQKLTYAAKTIEISATATSPILSDAQPPTDRYLFRTVPNDLLQAKALAIFAYTGPSLFSDAGTPPVIDSGITDGGADSGTVIPTGGGCRKMAIVYNNDDYGVPFEAALKLNFEDPTRAGPGAVVVEQPIPTDVQASYTAQINAIQTASPDCMAMIVYDPAGDELLREIRSAQSSGGISKNLTIFGTDGTFTNDFIVNGQTQKGVASSPSVAEGVYGTNPDPNPTQIDGYNDFSDLYLAQFALDPGATNLPGQVANFYDAAILAALAIEKAGTTDDPVKIRDSLYLVAKGTNQTDTKVVGPGSIGDALNYIHQGTDINYEGASGSCDFDQYGDVLGDYIIWQVIHPTTNPATPPSFNTVGKIRAAQLAVSQ
jgi:ABC-type branched-subunit amino acid transport system substrate-binding protein